MNEDKSDEQIPTKPRKILRSKTVKSPVTSTVKSPEASELSSKVKSPDGKLKQTKLFGSPKNKVPNSDDEKSGSLGVSFKSHLIKAKCYLTPPRNKSNLNSNKKLKVIDEREESTSSVQSPTSPNNSKPENEEKSKVLTSPPFCYNASQSHYTTRSGYSFRGQENKIAYASIVSTSNYQPKIEVENSVNRISPTCQESITKGRISPTFRQSVRVSPTSPTFRQSFRVSPTYSSSCQEDISKGGMSPILRQSARTSPTSPTLRQSARISPTSPTSRQSVRFSPTYSSSCQENTGRGGTSPTLRQSARISPSSPTSPTYSSSYQENISKGRMTPTLRQSPRISPTLPACRQSARISPTYSSTSPENITKGKISPTFQQSTRISPTNLATSYSMETPQNTGNGFVTLNQPSSLPAQSATSNVIKTLDLYQSHYATPRRYPATREILSARNRNSRKRISLRHQEGSRPISRLATCSTPPQKNPSSPTTVKEGCTSRYHLRHSPYNT